MSAGGSTVTAAAGTGPRDTARPPVPSADDRLVSAQGIAVSLFSGAGGLDLGAEAAGYEVRAAVEWDRDAAETMEKNFAHLESPVIRADILQTPTRQILQAAGLRPGERPDLLIGAPPCTPFSKSGFWLEWKREGLEPDASLLQAYTRVLAEARPRRFVLENVYALTYDNKASRPAFERLLREIDAAGYHCEAKVLNAADYGVPQSRPRLFVIGAPKDQSLPRHPEPTHGGQWGATAQRQPASAARHRRRSARGPGHRPRTRRRGQRQIRASAARHPARRQLPVLHQQARNPDPLFTWRSKYWSFLLKLAPGKPAPTIQAQPGPYVGPFHWDNRRLRTAEIKRLFTYPDDFEFTGTRSSVQAQLGNSVPPLLAEKVIAGTAGTPGS